MIKKRIVSVICAVCLLTSVVFTPMRAHAAFPVSDVLGAVLEQSLNAVGVMIIQRATQDVTKQVMEWAGEADSELGQAFVRDFSTYFVDIGKRSAYEQLGDIGTQIRQSTAFKKSSQAVGSAVGSVAGGINDAKKAVNDNPFARGFARQTLYNLRGKYADHRGYIGNDKFAARAGCDYNQYFYNSENCNGWGAWLALGEIDSNPIAVSIDMERRVVQKIQHAEDSAKAEVSAPAPILGKKKCVEKDKNGICTRYITLTPGTLVADQLSSALNLTNDQLANSDELHEAFGQFLGQILFSVLDNRVFSELGSQQQDNVFDISAFDDDLGVSSSTTTTVGIGDVPFVQPVTFDNTYTLQTELTDHIAKLDNLLQNGIDLGNNNIKDRIYDLDICIPGPDRNWETRLLDRCNNSFDDSCRSERLKSVNAISEKLKDTEINTPNFGSLISFCLLYTSPSPRD